MSESVKTSEIERVVVPICGLCGHHIRYGTKGKRCGRCNAVFTNPEILPWNKQPLVKKV